MSIDMGDPGLSGYGGYVNQGNSANQSPAHEGQSSQQPVATAGTQASSGVMQPSAANGNSGTAGVSDGVSPDADGQDQAEALEESQFNYENVPGFESSASACFNRAAQIAQSLNHTNLSADHLMLALTMDPNARKLLERVGDIVQLREAAMRRVAQMPSRVSRNSDDQLLPPTSDLSDVAKRAREMAAEREQQVAISDLVGAFPRANGRLTYGATDASQAMALMVKIEQNLVPRVADAMTRIEMAVREAMQHQHQSVQSILQDLNSRQSMAMEQRQREFMDEIRRQVRDAADTQIAAVLGGFRQELDAKLAALKPAPAPVPETAPVEVSATTRPSRWSWLVF